MSRRAVNDKEHEPLLRPDNDERDDWEWRRRIRANPRTRHAYRIGVFVAGLLLIGVGIPMIPLPGPGWVVVILGLAVWASEFEKAADAKEWIVGHIRTWERWIMAQNLAVKGAVALGSFLVVLAALWLSFRLTGVPGFFPDQVQAFLRERAGL